MLDYAKRQTAPLEKKLKVYRESLHKAELAYKSASTRKENLARSNKILRWSLLIAVFVVFLLGLVVGCNGRPGGTGTATNPGSSSSVPQATTSPTASNPSLEEAANELLQRYYVATRNGGLGNEEVLDEYFSSPFYWYGAGEKGDPITDRAAFADRHNESGFNTEKCTYYSASATKITTKDDGIIVVDAIIPWISRTRSDSGVVTDRYLLKKATTDLGLQIYSVVDKPRFGQRAC